MNEYLYCLLTQFNKSKGFKKIDLNSIYYFEEFSEWLETQEKISKIYRSYLHNFGLDINDSKVAEVGKGKYDSIALPNTKIISPFGETMGKENSKLTICQDKSIIVGPKSEEEFVGKFITQNPYDDKLIENWELLHFNNNDICVGMYGSIKDKDCKKKIKVLLELKAHLLGENKLEVDTVNDKYIAFLKSDRKKLVKKLGLTR